MTDHEAFSNWLREHEGYAAAAENLSEAELYSRIVKLPQHQHSTFALSGPGNPRRR